MARNRVPLGVAALLVVSLFFYGKFRIAGESQVESIRLRTLLVQLNIPQEAARMLWTDLETHQGYEDETLKALESLKSPDGKISEKWPDWVMWPEVALTGRLLFTDSGARGIPENNRETLAQIRTAGEFTLIYGAGELEGEPAGEYLAYKEKGRSYNSMAVVPPDDSLQTYRKHHLVIFGETIPFVDSLPFLKEIYKQQSGAEYTGSFNAGDSLEPLPILVGERKISAIPSICFEDSVARLTRKFVRPEPQVIVNITNDGWFKQTAGAAQHFSNSRFRAIELRRPMLRCANTGISAAVDSTGSTAHPETGAPQIIVDQNGSHFTRGSLLAEIKIPLKPSFSLFALIGDWGLIFTGIAGLTMAIFTRKSE
ncbi:MAG: apolipoprotein N-acyltransferase [Akkermansiaceae bacterium]|nr:apolipoprotein N-acyltransferase [Akkermansiaceae bacterium]